MVPFQVACFQGGYKWNPAIAKQQKSILHDQLGNHFSRRRFYPPEMVAFE